MTVLVILSAFACLIAGMFVHPTFLLGAMILIGFDVYRIWKGEQ